jgi:hypothetical protein
MGVSDIHLYLLAPVQSEIGAAAISIYRYIKQVVEAYFCPNPHCKKACCGVWGNFCFYTTVPCWYATDYAKA